MKSISKIFTILSIVVALSSCNDTDNVYKIFTKDTKKLTMLLTASSTNPKEQNFWGDDLQAKIKSMEIKEIEGNYEINFEGETDGDYAWGTFKGRVVNATIEGTWSANGSNHEASLTVRVNGRETDPLANAFIAALREGVFKYEGDDQSLSLFYDPKNKSLKKFMGFQTVKRNRESGNNR